jgi:hypothetical protein
MAIHPLAFIDAVEETAKFLFFKGYKHMGSGMVFGKTASGASMGAKMAFGGYGLTVLPYAAARTAMAPRGEKGSTGIAAGLGVPLAALAGGVVGGPVGALAATLLLGPALESNMAKGLQSFAEFGRNQRRLETGGYKDTARAYTMRQRAAQELSGSLLNARQILGREAAYMHQ